LSRPLVSIVTPFYNTGEYLQECIDSVLAQTYGDFEYVLLDNCSTDGGDQIARAAAARDARIRFVSAESLVGMAENFNRALRLISPESRYTKMVLADDFIFPACLERMVDVAESDRSVGVVGCYLLAGRKIANQGLPFPGSVVAGKVPCRMYLMQGPHVFGNQTAVMYRSDLVRARAEFFPLGSLLIDTEACILLLRESAFGFVHDVMAYARTREESASDVMGQFDPYPLHRLVMLRKYGRDFLTPAEFATQWDAQYRRYVRSLGEHVLRGLLRPGSANRAFWAYHRAEWEDMNYRVGLPRLGLSAVAAAADLALNPKSTIERAAGRRRQHS